MTGAFVACESQKIAKLYISVQEQNKKLLLDNKTLLSHKSRLEYRIKALEEKLASMAKVYKDAGVSWATFSSDSWHQMNSHVTNFLFGWKTWKATKVWLKIYFPQMEQERSISGPLTHFESVLAVMMCWWVPMQQDLAALILDVDQSVISRKVNKWGPELAHKAV